MSAGREIATTGFVGGVLGFALSRMGFSSWDEVHAMFTFTDLRLTLTFGMSVVVLGLAFFLVARTTGATWRPRAIHRGTLVGGALFGAGWAISGACPSIALVQIGEGQFAAVATLGGILAGNWLYAAIHERWLRWPTEGCADE